MILANGNLRFEIEKDKLILFDENLKLYQVDLKDMLQYSLDRPWKLLTHQWEKVHEELVEGEMYFAKYSDGIVCAEIQLAWKENYISADVSYKNESTYALFDFVAGFTMPVAGNDKHKVTIPHMIYNDNPSGEADRIIPHIGNEAGKGLIVEEHRLPIPAVNIEWRSEDGFSYVTLLSVPEVHTGNVKDYWSLGVIKSDDGEAITSLSGPLEFNGTKDIVYGGRCTPLSYQEGYRILSSGESIGKHFCISFGQTGEGRGFRSLIDLGFSVLRPETKRLHTPEEMIAYKKNVLDSRSFKDDKSEGYLTFGTANSFGNISGRQDYYLYGWTGQAIRLAWCDCKLGLETEETYRFERGCRIIDFFTENGESAVPGLFYGYYNIEEASWRGAFNQPEANLSSRIEGESISDLIDVMMLFKEKGREVPKQWEAVVRRACAFLMDESRQTGAGIYPVEWTKKGEIEDDTINTAGMPCVIALAKASEYFKEDSYLIYAKEKCEKYYDVHMKTFEIPFSHATLDARCEDKEAGLYFFVAAAELYRLTNEEKYKEWAAISGDWILTFVFFWETGFQKGTQCYEKNFKTTGWPGVSVQNHHLDVFFPSYDMYAFGRRSGIKRFEEMGAHVNDAMTYGVCTKPGEWGYSVIGEQGEQYYNTNYFQVRYPSILEHMDNWRGGMQRWNPSWITAQVMSNAIRFRDGY